MKKMLLMLLVVGTVCFGCKDDKGKSPPPIGATTYLDVENLWTMYLKDIQTVKDSLTAGTFVSERDSVLPLYKNSVRRLLTFKKDTPAGPCKIECFFHKDTLVNLFVTSEQMNAPMEIYPHYMAISNDIQKLTEQLSVFPFGAEYNANVMLFESGTDILREFWGAGNPRKQYLDYFTPFMSNYKPAADTMDSKYFCMFQEMWFLREYDPVIGCPVDLITIDKYITIIGGVRPNGKIMIGLELCSKYNTPPYTDDEYLDE